MGAQGRASEPRGALTSSPGEKKGEREWDEATWRGLPQNHRRGGLPQLSRTAWKSFPNSQKLPSEGTFQRTYGSIHGPENLLNTPAGPRKSKADVILSLKKERSDLRAVDSFLPPYLDSGLVGCDSPREERWEGEARVKTERADQT